MIPNSKANPKPIPNLKLKQFLIWEFNVELPQNRRTNATSASRKNRIHLESLL